VKRVLGFRPSDVEFAFDVGQRAGVSRLHFDLLLHFTLLIFAHLALRLVLHQWALNRTDYERGYLRAAAYECGYSRAVAICPLLVHACACALMLMQESKCYEQCTR
jgi:hypothetical protein